MSDINGLFIITLVLFCLSIIFKFNKVQPLSLYLQLLIRVNGRTKVVFGLITASIFFWGASHCIGTCQARYGVGRADSNDIQLEILFISHVSMVIVLNVAGILQAVTENVKKDSLCNAEAETENGSGATGKRKAKKKNKTASGSVLEVSNTILGHGSQGTIVFQGSFQGRPVAIKRLLRDFIHIATHEASILQQCDRHPNVIRYFYQESRHTYVYLALELCLASLADIIENSHDTGSGSGREGLRDIVQEFDGKRAMRQIANGLGHLHGLGLVHRDIKPQNILVSSSSSSGAREYIMLISDFGICKKLDLDQTSFLPTANGGTAAGTVGWRAPEILCGDAKWYELSINGTSSFPPGRTTTTTIHLTKSVDIFALGCLYYYILTNGRHPYGTCFDREANIIKDNKDLSLLRPMEEPQDLITHMLQRQPSQRPDTNTCLLHPFFWDDAKRLGFLQDASDRFEIICKNLKDMALICRLERDAGSVIGSDWHQALDQMLVDNLRQYRKYDGGSVRGLLRALRNKKHHYHDFSEDLKRHLGPMPEGFLGYFAHRYPRLLMHVHEVVKDMGLHPEPMFSTYFKLPEP